MTHFFRFSAVFLTWHLIASGVLAAPSFLNEVVPLLTRLGCNQGSCHGKGAGQNGFRLSLRGYAPEQDYESIVREFGSRRVDLSVPERSILLQKITGHAPHEGGKLLETDSREYQTLLSWLKSGATKPQTEDPTIVKLELQVGKHLLKVGEKQQLRAIAHFSDRTTQDVTWLTRFDSNDGAVVSVSENGEISASRTGATSIRAAFLTEVAVQNFTIPDARVLADARFPVVSHPIDKMVFSQLQRMQIPPASVCDDATFIRRAFLDAAGILPTSDEVTDFVASRVPNKRELLIDQLLHRSEFVDYWTLKLCDLLQNRVERDHDVRGVRGVREFHAWVREQVAAERGWNEIARNVLLAKGNSRENPGVGYYIVTVGEQRQVEKSDVAQSVAQAFLGTRIGCAQCHNHPLEKYTQDDFYHFAAFFSRVKLNRKKWDVGDTELIITSNDPSKKLARVGLNQPRTGKFLAPQNLDRQPADIPPGGDPREVLVNWITSKENKLFSGAMANRIWQHFLGSGLVEPVDDLRATNPPTNPELWDYLSDEFVKSNFSFKHLIKRIMTSTTYQLSSSTMPENASDQQFYSHYYIRRLPAEVLLDAINQATSSPDRFEGYPEGIRAVQMPDSSMKSYFLSMFGRSDRVSACACERSGEVTLPQLLHLQNGDSLLQKIHSPTGTIEVLAKQKLEKYEIIKQLSLRTISRIPTSQEWKLIEQELQNASSSTEVYRDLLWALINSKEFTFNH
ncbi:MAG: DUF1553 domain-containing protein [Zavarzinella sp.]